MHFVLRPDPAHDRTLAPSLNDSGERVRTEHSVTNSQFVWSGESGEQARYRQIRPTEAIADKVGAAVCKLASVSPRQCSLILALPPRWVRMKALTPSPTTARPGKMIRARSINPSGEMFRATKRRRNSVSSLEMGRRLRSAPFFVSCVENATKLLEEALIVYWKILMGVESCAF